MFRRSVSSFVILFAYQAFASAEEKPIEIPLKDIWALDMPGTRNLRDLDPSRKAEPRTVEEFIRTSLVERTVQALDGNNWPKKGHRAGRAFIVRGTDVDALHETYAVLSKEKKRGEFFPANQPLTLVFYSYSTGRYVHLDKVERDGQTINVHYHLVAHRTLDMSTYVALIPLGELPSGKMRVRIKQTPNEDQSSENYTADRVAQRLICESFEFMVREPKK